MNSNVIQDRGRGPEIGGTRITVYNLLHSFLDPNATEAEICRVYHLTPEQVAAARAYVLSNVDTVLAEHLRIEERMAVENPPEVRQQAERAKATFKSFKEWQSEMNRSEVSVAGEPHSFPTFREWLAEKATD